MKSVKINLSSIDRVRGFCNICMSKHYDIDVCNDRYVVDAKSIMGLFSLNLSEPLTCNVPSSNFDEFVAEIEEYVCD